MDPSIETATNIGSILDALRKAQVSEDDVAHLERRHGEETSEHPCVKSAFAWSLASMGVEPAVIGIGLSASAPENVVRYSVHAFGRRRQTSDWTTGVLGFSCSALRLSSIPRYLGSLELRDTGKMDPFCRAYIDKLPELTDRLLDTWTAAHGGADELDRIRRLEEPQQLRGVQTACSLRGLEELLQDNFDVAVSREAFLLAQRHLEGHRAYTSGDQPVHSCYLVRPPCKRLVLSVHSKVDPPAHDLRHSVALWDVGLLAETLGGAQASQEIDNLWGGLAQGVPFVGSCSGAHYTRQEVTFEKGHPHLPYLLETISNPDLPPTYHPDDAWACFRLEMQKITLGEISDLLADASFVTTSFGDMLRANQ